jgi:hypothetical protein
MRRALLGMTLLAIVASLTSDSASACFRRYRRVCVKPCLALCFVVPSPLTAESARQAIIKMLSSDGAPNFDTRITELTALRNGQHLLVLEKGAEGILSGHWNIDLDRKSVSFICPIGFCLYNCTADFEFIHGEWHACLRGQSWAYHGPKGI